ncbi:MAG: diguanylate cyclase [Oceanospirillaceae bacterium]|nr:diguanylate cyclase [Oceanospirillaceae bacterium]
MVQTRPSPTLSDGYLQLFPVGKEQDQTVFERFCQHRLPPFEVAAALRNENRILTHLNGCGAPHLHEAELNADDSRTLLRTQCRMPLNEISPLQLSLSQRLKIAVSMARALCLIHERDVLHLALRPSTFLFSADFEQAVILDFSSARHVPKDVVGLASFRPVMADPHFLAPEQGYQFSHTLDRRTDLYAFGCVLSWLFSGETPFHWLNEDSAIGYAQIAQPLMIDIKLGVSEEADERIERVSTALSAMLSALLEKEPTDRYQSCPGVLADLQALLEYQLEHGTFCIREQDCSDHLYIPQRLYGRDAKTQILMQAFQRVAKGPSEALLIAGYSGVGKSALVNELRLPVLQSNGLFVAGKFDQYRGSTPYSAIEQAFSHFVHALLALPDVEVALWRDRLNDALQPNAQVLIDILPDLGYLLGPQQTPAPLGAEEQQNRFNRVFLQFVREICTAHKPLVVFIDDLQWADLASINLLRLLMMDTENRYCLLLGAYRDNEVDDRHPFVRILQDLKLETSRLSQIELMPVSPQALCELMGDTLALSLAQVHSLSELVYRKTAGNPFFFRQFLHELYQQGLLVFDYGENHWCWSESDIERQASTENVIDLMIAKIGRLPQKTQHALMQASCIGGRFPVDLVTEVHTADTAMDAILQPALDMGLILRVESAQGGPCNGVLSFLHDRVQQAAYTLLDKQERMQLHHRIGCMLLDRSAGMNGDIADNRCFELVSHFNCALTLLTDQQCQQVMELNLQAAKKAKSTSAYKAAIEYLGYFFELAELSGSVSESALFDAKLERLECLYLAGEYDCAEQLRPALEGFEGSTDQKARLHVVLITQYTRMGQLDKAISQAQCALADLNYLIPAEPTMDDVGAAIESVQRLLTETPFNQLSKKTPITNPQTLHQLDILIAMQPCCYNSGSLLFPLTILGLLRLTLTEGNSQHSSYVYMMYGLMCTKVLKDYDTAFEAAKYSRIVGEHFPASPLVEGRLQMMLSNFVLPWQQPLTLSSNVRDAAYHRCLEQGDYYWGVHAYIFGFYADLMVCTSIDTLLHRMEQVSATCEKIKQPAQVYLSTLQCNLLKVLSGELDNQHSLDHVPGYEAEAQEYYVATNYMCGRYDRLLGRLLQGYLFGNYEEALNVSLSEDLIPADLDEGIFHEAVYTQFNLLTVLALKQVRPEAVSARWQDWFDKNWPLLQRWYAMNPDNFAPGFYLVSAELAVLEGQELNALGAFEHAILSARDGGFALWQALANERMGKFRNSRQQDTLGKAYLEESISLYQRWGAGAKAAELECFIRTINPEHVISAGHRYDWHLISTATQELSRLLDVDDLAHRMLSWSTKATGAQRAALYTWTDQGWSLDNLLQEGVAVDTRTDVSVIPEAMLNYCRNSQSFLLLDDAVNIGDFVLDPYVTLSGCRSVLLIPLYHHDQLLSVLHLDHSDTRNLFTAQRLSVLELLSSQFASSYHNSVLYGQLQAHNAVLENVVQSRTVELRQKSDHLQSVLDALPIPYVMTREDGSLVECNALFMRHFGLTHNVLEGTCVGALYADPKDRKRMLEELAEQGQVIGFECELQTLQGERCWGLFSATYIDVNDERRIFAAVSDISERKALEHQLQEQANTDPLTGVYNRRGLMGLGNQLRSVSGDKPLCIAMIDLDHFKHLNDTYGHVAGDQVLKAFTAAVQQELREADLFGRLGGEEFAVILPGQNLERAASVLERIRMMTEMLVVEFEQRKMGLTMSAGLACWSKGESMTDVLGRADLRLYDAKQSGRNQIKAD